jgi:hypothetical protein
VFAFNARLVVPRLTKRRTARAAALHIGAAPLNFMAPRKWAPQFAPALPDLISFTLRRGGGFHLSPTRALRLWLLHSLDARFHLRRTIAAAVREGRDSIRGSKGTTETEDRIEAALLGDLGNAMRTQSE